MRQNREQRRAEAIPDLLRTHEKLSRHSRLSPGPKVFPSLRSSVSLPERFGTGEITTELTCSKINAFAESPKSVGLFLHCQCGRTQSVLLRSFVHSRTTSLAERGGGANPVKRRAHAQSADKGDAVLQVIAGRRVGFLLDPALSLQRANRLPRFKWHG
jgi:hypothetical protein